MRRNLVACTRDPANKVWTSLGHPAEHEARAGNSPVGIGEEFQEAVGIPFDAEARLVPRFARNSTPEVLDVEPILHVDRHRGRRKGLHRVDQRYSIRWPRLRNSRASARFGNE